MSKVRVPFTPRLYHLITVSLSEGVLRDEDTGALKRFADLMNKAKGNSFVEMERDLLMGLSAQIFGLHSVLEEDEKEASEELLAFVDEVLDPILDQVAGREKVFVLPSLEKKKRGW